MSTFSSAFTKYHGNGNDFIIFDLTEKTSLYQIIIDNARDLCHRHRGIGADGVILLANNEHHFHMTIVNADGSLANNCGNGLRCAAAYLFKERKIIGPIEIVLNNRIFLCQKIDDEISVAMGSCRIVQLDEIRLDLLPGLAKCAFGHIGNSHLAILVDKPILDEDGLLNEVRRKTANASDLNIGFLSIEPSGRIISKVFERGVGWTNSCGTGACIAASFVALLFPDQINPVIISQPGGDVSITVSLREKSGNEATFDIVQRGKAAESFTGICQLAKT